MEVVQNELDHVSKRQRTVNATTCSEIQNTIDLLTSFQTSLDNTQAHTGSTSATSLARILQTASKSAKTIMKKNKELGGSLSKLGKSIDKTFNADAIKITRPEAFLNKEQAISASILEHLLHSGHLQLGQTFMNESQALLAPSRWDIYATSSSVLVALKILDVSPALRWINACRPHAGNQMANLEFKLHALHFIKLLRQQERTSAIVYAQRHLSKFGASNSHAEHIKRLMTCLLYPWDQLQLSKYADLVDPIRWFEATELFIRESALFAGLPAESPLAVCVNTGCVALPKLMKVAAVVQDSNSLMQKTELPVEIELGECRLYHSVFTCPVSRETACKENPPMRLPCGHVICRESLQKIAKSNRRKFKCTYCPSEQLLVDTEIIKF